MRFVAAGQFGDLERRVDLLRGGEVGHNDRVQVTRPRDRRRQTGIQASDFGLPELAVAKELRVLKQVQQLGVLREAL